MSRIENRLDTLLSNWGPLSLLQHLSVVDWVSCWDYKAKSVGLLLVGTTTQHYVWVISQLLGLGCPTELHPLHPQRLNLRGLGSILKRSHGTCGPDLQPTAACVSAGIMRLNINSRDSAQFSLMELTWMSVHGVHVLPLTCCARLYEAD